MPTKSGNRPKLAFVSLKAFGDLIIAVTSLNRLKPEDRGSVALLVGEHLIPLVSVLAAKTEVRTIELPLEGPAPLFDVKKRGWRAAFASAVSLRPAINQCIRGDETLVFDTIGIRERFLAAGRRSVSLPAADNIYIAYETLLTRAELSLSPISAPAPTGQLVRIFAGARLPHRQIPIDVLRKTMERVDANGGRAEIMLLEGERIDLENAKLPATVVPRGFGNMLDALRGADAVISPDSMTAHMAEFCRKPVFILTPEDKPYWMPRFAFDTGAIALFKDDLSTGLDDFLTRFASGY